MDHWQGGWESNPSGLDLESGLRPAPSLDFRGHSAAITTSKTPGSGIAAHATRATLRATGRVRGTLRHAPFMNFDGASRGGDFPEELAREKRTQARRALGFAPTEALDVRARNLISVRVPLLQDSGST